MFVLLCFPCTTENDLLFAHSVRKALAKAVMEDPHKDAKMIRPKTPAAFIFDRPSTAAERLATVI